MIDERLNRIVGLLVLPVLLAGVLAVLAVGRRPLRPVVRLQVEFDQVTMLKVGDQVRIGPVVVGRIEHLSLSHRVLDGKPTPRVRAHLYVERRYQRHVLRNSKLYVSSLSLIGERHLEIATPDEAPGPPVRSGDVLMGEPPALMDRFLSLGWQSMQAMNLFSDAMKPHWDALRPYLGRLEDNARLLEDYGRRFQRLGERAEPLARQLRDQLRDLAASTDDFRAFTRVGQGLEALGERLRLGVKPLATKVETVADDFRALKRLYDTRFPPAERELRARGKSLEQRVASLRAQLEALSRHVDRGEGTIGAFMKDKEIRDDFKVSGRIIRQQIWRTIARPDRTTPRRSPVVP
jgi:ABC-type transporter Mla subunit MlaD